MATITDFDSASSLIQEYQQQNSAAGGPGLITPDENFLNGFFIDRQSIEDALSDPDAAGISVVFAKHPDFVGAPDNVFTLIFSGSVTSEPGALTPYTCTGNIYCDPPPCPPSCGDLG